MKALVVDQPGPAAQVRIREIEDPRPGPAEVVVQVEWAAVNFADLTAARGLYPYASRPPLVPGVEVVGRVVPQSPDETPRRVCAFVGSGGWAERVSVHRDLVVPLPDDADPLAVAAGLTVVATVQLCADQARMESGEHVLVHGASGGIGSVAAQVLKGAGAGSVTGTLRNMDRAELARAHGYDHVVSATRFPVEVPGTVPGGAVDVVIDGVGGWTRAASFALLRPFGRLVAIGNSSRGSEEPPTGAELRAANTAVVGASLGALSSRTPHLATAYLERAVRDLACGSVSLPVDVLAADRLTDVLGLLEGRAADGKLVLDLTQGVEP
ncbi:quinone oxidoreductase family protein [Nocardioides humi]|uniref:Zinc-binding dehydrogenase n=1 Tax=Nocardioides humi TaxID=449461 RepID=A0ABN2BRT9_9ACTN|nr:zinc-binding dehydrogenase [Nocardioides humi]